MISYNSIAKTQIIAGIKYCVVDVGGATVKRRCGVALCFEDQREGDFCTIDGVSGVIQIEGGGRGEKFTAPKSISR